ncbi:hypothetical protein LENED_002961 [Lentinula edodes]|uniref:Uncharacterized protein n=1 Tax=Lentinula edodes TaxID=5353 RepID=A0A1Q3E2B1_LENED|nr:hypothetical protein LENED_002961 [Lentinula edodes]
MAEEYQFPPDYVRRVWKETGDLNEAAAILLRGDLPVSEQLQTMNEAEAFLQSQYLLLTSTPIRGTGSEVLIVFIILTAAGSELVGSLGNVSDPLLETAAKSFSQKCWMGLYLRLGIAPRHIRGQDKLLYSHSKEGRKRL